MREILVPDAAHLERMAARLITDAIPRLQTNQCVSAFYVAYGNEYPATLRHMEEPARMMEVTDRRELVYAAARASVVLMGATSAYFITRLTQFEPNEEFIKRVTAGETTLMDRLYLNSMSLVREGFGAYVYTLSCIAQTSESFVGVSWRVEPVKLAKGNTFITIGPHPVVMMSIPQAAFPGRGKLFGPIEDEDEQTVFDYLTTDPGFTSAMKQYADELMSK